MLERLQVDNLVVLRSAEIEPAPGMTVITGETGAGKTILAGALGLVLGAKGEAGLVGPHAEQVEVEATFRITEDMLRDDAFEGVRELIDDVDDGLLVSRRLGADGRGRTLVQGRSATRGALEDAGGRLVGVVSQHESRRLAKPAAQRAILDAFGGDKQAAKVVAMGAAWRALVAARGAREQAEAEAAGLAGRIAELEGIAERIAEIQPRAGELDELEVERQRLRYADVLAEGTSGAAALLSPDDGAGALGMTGEAERAVRAAADRDPELAPIADELREAVIRLEEASRSLHAYADGIEHDPARLEQVEARLDRLTDLVRRHGSLDEAIAAGEEAERLLAVARGDAGGLDAVRAAETAAQAAADAAAAALTKARAALGPKLATAVQGHLADLGMADAAVEIELAERDLGVSGTDEVRILLAPNPGLKPAPIADAASGGELSRVALALRVAAHDRDAVPTLVFDEVDAGVGGATAVAVGQKLRELAASTQVIVITHLAQIAALADCHYRVLKVAGDPTETTIEVLDDGGVDAELARMLGGDASATEALELARKLRVRA
ncbi:MAG: AAA family ATPase [Actinobacteria bacterium]|nr:AAA family ATPase [Actinomycetota bacterium]